MERERNSSESSEAGEGDTPSFHTMLQNPDLSRPGSRTRTSSEEELTLLSENADPNVQDPHERNSIFWPPRSPAHSNSSTIMRGSSSAPYPSSNNPPRRVRPNRPWTSRERYFNNNHLMNQQLPYLYYRQYLRQEILRSYMSPLHRLPIPSLLTTRSRLPAVFTWNPVALSNPIVQISSSAQRRSYVSPQNSRQGYSGSSNSSTGSNPSSSSYNGSQSNSASNSAAIIDRLNFIGMAEADIHKHTLLIMKQEESEDDMTCVICMSMTTKCELLRKLPCRHVFHKECIDKWLGFNGICPTCRRDVRCRRPSSSPAP